MAKEVTEKVTDGVGTSAMEFEELTSTLWEELAGWAHAGVAMLPNMVIAMVVLLVGWGASQLIATGVKRALDRLSDNEKANSLFSTVSRLAVLGGALFVALGVLELDKTVTSLLAGVGVLGLALGFAFQDIAANFISGIFMAFRHEFRQGDIIESNGFVGRVKRITLRSTHLLRFSGEEVIIPNKDVFSTPLENLSSSGTRRLDVEVGVAYGSDLDKVERVTREALEALDCRVSDKDVDVLFVSFGGSSIDLIGRFWVRYSSQLDYVTAKSLGIKSVAQAYETANIDIPFPIRTVRLADDMVDAFATRMSESLPSEVSEVANG